MRIYGLKISVGPEQRSGKTQCSHPVPLHEIAADWKAAASIGLVLYFVGATVSHLRVGDVKGVGPAAFMLALAVGALALRILTVGTPQ